MIKNKITLTCIMGVDPEKFDLNLIYHFIDHYRKIGIKKFLITVNADTEAKTIEGINILKECGIEPTKIWIGEFLINTKMSELQALQKVVETDWIIVVDSDEFIRLNQESLEKIVSACESTGYIACRGHFVDRLAIDQKFLPVSKECNLYEKFPIEKSILQKYTEEKKHLQQNRYAIDYKCFLFRTNGYKSSNGQHFLCYKKATNLANGSDRLEEQYYYPEWFLIDHFKWTKTCAYRLKKRLESYLADPYCTWTDEILWVYNFVKNN